MDFLEKVLNNLPSCELVKVQTSSGVEIPGSVKKRELRAALQLLCNTIIDVFFVCVSHAAEVPDVTEPIPGEEGEPGEFGDPGPKGFMGFEGPPGEQGTVGTQGFKGERGDVGNPGLPTVGSKGELVV